MNVWILLLLYQIVELAQEFISRYASSVIAWRLLRQRLGLWVAGQSWALLTTKHKHFQMLSQLASYVS
jgi:hypothetical protein